MLLASGAYCQSVWYVGGADLIWLTLVNAAGILIVLGVLAYLVRHIPRAPVPGHRVTTPW
jgi:hypothetical protein